MNNSWARFGIRFGLNAVAFFFLGAWAFVQAPDRFPKWAHQLFAVELTAVPALVAIVTAIVLSRRNEHKALMTPAPQEPPK
jgi:hypothetical protein